MENGMKDGMKKTVILKKEKVLERSFEIQLREGHD